MVPFPICHSEAGKTSAPINIYTVPFHHADANDTHQRCAYGGVGWGLKDRGELGSDPLSRVTPSQLPSGVGGETVSVTDKRELLGAGSPLHPLHKEGRKWGKL